MTAHPCPFPDAVLDIFEAHMPKGRILKVLDPFAGIGRIHELRIRSDHRLQTWGTELEEEWVAKATELYGDRGGIALRRDATDLGFPDDGFDVIATSPAFGNRMADGYAGERCKACSTPGVRDAVDPPCEECGGTGRKLRSRRHTYRLSLGRPLTRGNGAAMQWGVSYRDLHARCITEFMRVLKPGGLVMLDIKNHRRDGAEQPVMEWWIAQISVYAHLRERIPVDTSGLQHSGPDINDLQEYVLIFEKGAAA